MNKNLIIRDLKLDKLLDVMADGSEELMHVCKKRLLNGLSSLTEVLSMQKKIKEMISDPSKTEKIYLLANCAFQKSAPYKNALHPRNAGALSMERKLDAHLNLSIIMSENLSLIFQLLENKEMYMIYKKQTAELKKLLNCNVIYHLSGSFVDGLKTCSLTLNKMECQISEPWKLHYPFINKTQKHNMGANFKDRCSDTSHIILRNTITLNLIKLIASYEKVSENLLSDLLNDYGFGMGAIHLHEKLNTMEIKTSYPKFVSSAHSLSFHELTDLSLVFEGVSVISNSADLNNIQITLITGANQGGKTTFLRSVGQAQLMAHSGLFTASGNFVTEFHSGIFTHFPDEENTACSGGLLDSELGKMDHIISCMTDKSLLLMNESFLTTTEYDSYLISQELMNGFLLTNVKVMYVTHNYSFAINLYKQKLKSAAFLKASVPNGKMCSYKIFKGAPERSAHALHLYKNIMDSL